jgi:hypothetical protein
MKRLFILLMLSAIPVIGFCQGLIPFTWLSGTWEMPRPKGGYRLETWAQKDANTLTGKGLRFVGTDTTLLEAIKIYADQHGVWYAPTVPDQNNGQEVAFKLVSSEKNHYVFENPKHDFPQRIAYVFKPVIHRQELISSTGDTLVVDATSLDGEGIHFKFLRK